MRLHVEHGDGSLQVFDFKPGNLRLGRNPECEVRFDNARYPKVSSFHAELQPNGDHWILRPLSQSNRTLHNNEPIDVPSRIAAGDRIRLGFTGPIIHVVSLANGDATPAGTMLADEANDVLEELRSLTTLNIENGGVIGRDTSQADFVLDHPHVSRAHCLITTSGDQVVVKDLGGVNGTFVNGHRISQPTLLNPGDSLDIGPFLLELRGHRLIGRSRCNNVQLVAERLGFVVGSEVKDQPTRLLDDIELVINPGEFVCILGPSGSGKSTLLRALSGRTIPSEGEVCINGRNLHENFAALKSDLSVIPQTISLHDTLSVEQSLYYSAALRLAPDLGPAELAKSVDSGLATVGMTQRRSVKISQLSGGQLKRIGLASELISDPSLLFLDEVTSGLDEQSDLEMMQLFRKLADARKTLVCVTHNLGHVAEYCTHVAVLTNGGRLAFYGEPTEAIDYFKVQRLSEVYKILEKRSPELWAKTYVQSSYYRKHVVNRKPAMQKKVSQAASVGIPAIQTAATWGRQLVTILKRTACVAASDKVALATLVGQPVLVGLLLCLVFGRFGDLSSGNSIERLATTQNLLFLLNVSCFWLGCNTSVKELVKERAIYIRERNFNLIPEAYFTAKLVFFAVIAVLQVLLLGIIVFAWFDPPGNVLGMLGTLCLLALAGSALGQSISALSKSEETAIAVVPMAVIPQIILGGVVASLSGASAWFGKTLATVFWGQHLLTQRLPETERIEREFQPTDLDALLVVGMHMTVFLIAAWIGVRRTGRHS